MGVRSKPVICHLCQTRTGGKQSKLKAPWRVPVEVADKEPRPSIIQMMIPQHLPQRRRKELWHQTHMRQWRNDEDNRTLKCKRVKRKERRSHPSRSDLVREKSDVLFPLLYLLSLASTTTYALLPSFTQPNPLIQSSTAEVWGFHHRLSHPLGNCYNFLNPQCCSLPNQNRH